jgi:hypothetical protein
MNQSTNSKIEAAIEELKQNSNIQAVELQNAKTKNK